ncbi:hypothetical protein HDU78_010310, partial [Chytriomyces hyalinus]
EIGVDPKVKTISAHGLFASASQLAAYASAILGSYCAVAFHEAELDLAKKRLELQGYQ